MAFALCLALGVACFFLVSNKLHIIASKFVNMMMVGILFIHTHGALIPGQICSNIHMYVNPFIHCSMTHQGYVVGSILILISIAMLRGPMAHIRHMMSVERLPFTLSYLGTMAMTLYFSLGVSDEWMIWIYVLIQYNRQEATS